MSHDYRMPKIHSQLLFNQPVYNLGDSLLKTVILGWISEWQKSFWYSSRDGSPWDSNSSCSATLFTNSRTFYTKTCKAESYCHQKNLNFIDLSDSEGRWRKATGHFVPARCSQVKCGKVRTARCSQVKCGMVRTVCHQYAASTCCSTFRFDLKKFQCWLSQVRM
jgi:hypothetical protein